MQISSYIGAKVLTSVAVTAVLAIAMAASPATAQGKSGGGGASPNAGGGAVSGSTSSGGGGKSVSGGATSRSFSGGTTSRTFSGRTGTRSSTFASRDGRRIHHRRGARFGYSDGYGYTSSCSYYHQRALATGSRYWWRRYRECIGDY